jgi:pyruvate ferredoxin oxidoreductase delta subunit
MAEKTEQQPKKEKTWKDIETGFVVSTPGGARGYKTGDWRSMRPIYDQDRCVKCGVCYLYCPDSAIKIKEDGTVEVDDFYCKGCGICARECWTGAFTMVPLGDKQLGEKTRKTEKK